MYNNERIIAENTVDKCIEDGRLSGDSRIILFGAGQYSRALIDILGSRGIPVLNILDNNPAKTHSYCKGVEVIAPSDADCYSDEDSRFILCSKYWREMHTQLIGSGANEKSIIVIKLSTYGETLAENVKDLIQGRRIYRNIMKQYQKHKILFCPYSGSGDIYLIGSFLESYLEKERLEKYVLVVVSNACERVASLFHIESIFNIGGMENSRALTKYYMSCPHDCNMTIMNDSWEYIYTNPVEGLRGLYGMNFADMFRIFVFGLDADVLPRHPQLQDRSKELERIISEKGLVRGRTVLFAPYADTLTELPFDFWKELACRLQDKGYVVCTNLGSKEETEVEGTVGINFPLDIAPHLVNWMGGFIGVRSGFCDVISGTDARKVILYDKANLFFHASAYDYFSLKAMHLSEDAVEIQFDNRCPEVVLESVLGAFR